MEDVIVLLGDVGANYYTGRRDNLLKAFLNDAGTVFLCIHGNHERRPTTIPGYVETEWHGGKAWVQPEYPKVFLKDMKYLCSNIINQLVQLINNDSLMEVEAHLVGSGAKNLITQNSNEPIDLDYNLMIIDSEININNCREIKEYIRKQFNVILNKNGWNDCMDSTSVLTTEKRHFTKGNHTEFSIDLAIVFNDRNGCHRLIHEKTGFTAWDRYYWNLVPNSKDLFDRVADIKDEHLWNEVIDEYLEKKNMYLRRQDYNHPSFNVYVETVNQVFNKYFD